MYIYIYESQSLLVDDDDDNDERLLHMNMISQN